MHPTFQMITFLMLFSFHFELICMVLVLYGLEKSEGHAGAILQAKNIVDITWLSTDRYMKNSFKENMTKYHLYILSMYLWVHLGILNILYFKWL